MAPMETTEAMGQTAITILMEIMAPMETTEAMGQTAITILMEIMAMEIMEMV